MCTLLQRQRPSENSFQTASAVSPQETPLFPPAFCPSAALRYTAPLSCAVSSLRVC
ncbi:hypothetical protein HMPREF9123_2552 [Neisseria bacilliformis ATCC BAA-1200]|uniref:Uncharacterized protein n=1 Tax=Neisseria bacilliformis ATCC BAA-1200 TaxID=888742 RepID=F2BFP5_9NEIS|nr:hypothetical protein HMPREF9123_2552 [Neisseria bacilliformis ATCC BAA-1200]